MRASRFAFREHPFTPHLGIQNCLNAFTCRCGLVLDSEALPNCDDSLIPPVETVMNSFISLAISVACACAVELLGTAPRQSWCAAAVNIISLLCNSGWRL